MVQWLSQNPMIAVAIYLGITAGVSLAVKRLESSPRGQGALKILAALGVDLPKVGEGVAQLLGGKPPA